jgi:hypothetical protein
MRQAENFGLSLSAKKPKKPKKNFFFFRVAPSAPMFPSLIPPPLFLKTKNKNSFRFIFKLCFQSVFHVERLGRSVCLSISI